MTDPYMPDVVVEVAFDSGYTTADADRTWTDISDYVELDRGVGNVFGRQDELSTADANRLTLTLDNSDGRFTAGRAASPYYPNVKVGRPIRVTATPPGGSESTRFVGFVDQWPVEWDGSDAYAKATITATSRLSRLGLGRKMRSTPEESVLAPRPIAYYTLGDASGSTSAVESSGRGLVGPLTTNPTGPQPSPTFGNAIGSPADGLTAMEFPVDGAPMVADLPSATVRSLRVCFITDAGTDAHFLIEATRPDGTALRLAHNGSAGGSPYAARAAVGGVGIQGGSAAAGSLHDMVVTSSVADGGKLYLNGSLVASGAGTDFTNMTRFALDVKDATGAGTNTRGAVLCHAAVYDTILTADEVAAQADAVLSGTAGDTTDERLERILGWAGVAASEISTQAGSETMTYQETSGQSVVDALRECESTEGGVLFDGADGRVTFHNRSHRYTAPVAVTFDMAEQQVESDYAPKLDRSTLVNSVRVENPTTGWTADVSDAASADEYGTVTGSAKAVTDTYPPLVQKAWWLIASYAEPRPRVPSLTVDVLAQVGGTPSADDILALTVGSRIKVTNQPAQADATEADYFVEGYTETIGPESYRITFNLSPAHPSLSVFVLDDADRGVLDTGILAL